MILTRKPLIVLDWSAMKALPRDQHQLSDRFLYVLPDAAFIEVLTANPPEPAVTKLGRVLAANVNHFAVAPYWHDLWRQERSPSQCVPRLAILDQERTDAVRELITSEDANLHLVLHSKAFTTAHADHNRRRDTFVKFCNLFRKNARNRFPNWLSLTSDDAEFVRPVRLPDPVLEIATFTDANAQTARWRRALSIFPDRHALGRWSRLVVWYAMLCASDHTHRFENNWEDSFYALTASYCDGLVSLDKGLQKCVRSVFPNCRVYDSHQALIQEV